MLKAKWVSKYLLQERAEPPELTFPPRGGADAFAVGGEADNMVAWFSAFPFAQHRPGVHVARVH